MNRAAHFAAMAIPLAWFAAPLSAWAHVVCGDRVFPATLVMDDPGVGDELSFPTIQYAGAPKGGGGSQDISYGYEWDKTITEHFGFAINGDYQAAAGAGANVQGWDNVTLTLKDEFLCSEVNEFAASVGVVREFAHTGSSRLATAGIIDTVGNTAPTVYVGKGLGDYPIGLLRPLAVTGELGYAISDKPNVSPNELDYAVSLQYSIPYLQQHVKDVGLPPLPGNLVPLIEVSLSSPRGQPTTGIVSPGVLYEGDSWQLGIEVNIPANEATRLQQGLGFIAQFHLFLDDIFPNSLGKPIF
jgi:hypothetical protein